jgi:hypothetical protein
MFVEDMVGFGFREGERKLIGNSSRDSYRYIK